MPKQNRPLKKKQMLKNLQTESPPCLNDNCQSHYPAPRVMEEGFAVPAGDEAMELAARSVLSAMAKAFAGAAKVAAKEGNQETGRTLRNHLHQTTQLIAIAPGNQDSKLCFADLTSIIETCNAMQRIAKPPGKLSMPSN